MRNRQRGMSIWSAMFVISVFVFILFVGFKLGPAYADAFTMKEAFNSAVAQAKAPTREAVLEAMGKRLITENVGISNWERDVRVEKRGRATVAKLSYEVLIPMFYNVSVLLNFDFEKEMAGVE